MYPSEPAVAAGWFGTLLDPVTVCADAPLIVIVRPWALDAFQPLTFPMKRTHTAPRELKLETPPPPHVVVNWAEPAAHPPLAHIPFTHDPDVQAFAQPPQLLLSVCSLMHAPLQSV